MREACTNCSRISPDERLLLNPMLPVAQKLQPILHPTYAIKKHQPWLIKYVEVLDEVKLKTLITHLTSQHISISNLRGYAQGWPRATRTRLSIIFTQPSIISHYHSLHKFSILATKNDQNTHITLSYTIHISCYIKCIVWIKHWALFIVYLVSGLQNSPFPNSLPTRETAISEQLAIGKFQRPTHYIQSQETSDSYKIKSMIIDPIYL